MPLEFNSEAELEQQLQGEPEPEIVEAPPPVANSPQPLVFESEQDPQQQLAGAQPVEPVEAPPAPFQGQSNSLAELVLGSTVPEPQPQGVTRGDLLESYAPVNNTLQQKQPGTLQPLNPVDTEPAVVLLSESYPSMSPTGILLDGADRLSYSTSVMENTKVRADIRAQLVDQVMRDGKVIPEALPSEWYEARGLRLLPPDLDVNALGGLRQGE